MSSMRNYFFGGLGVVWGGAIVLFSLLRERPAGGAYDAGQLIGSVLGLLMLIAGGYTLINAKKRKSRRDDDADPASNLGTPAGAAKPVPPRFSLRNVIVLAVPLLAIVGSGAAYFYFSVDRGYRPNLPERVQREILSVMQLDDDFKDADGDLVADPPEQTLDPDKLVFRPLEEDAEVWEGFRVYLAKRLKRPVEISTEEAPRTLLINKFRGGDVHIASFSTGTVPTMVNAAGFVPAFCMANDKGEYVYKAVILVRAKSPIASLADIKGHTVTLTAMSSLSSFKAPLQVLGEAGLVMGKDYQIQFASSQRVAIEGLASGSYEIIAVASDLLQRTLTQKNLSDSQFRKLYESPESYPSACFGYHHALKKDLVSEIRKAFEEYSWDDRMKQDFGSAGYTRFAAISYKDDWAPVRKIDEKINRVLQGK